MTLIFTLVPGLADSPVRVPLGLLMVLFLPGYTLIAALFPNKDDLDGIERAALSFGLSIAVVPLIGLGLNYTPWGIRLAPVVISLSIFTIALATVAHLRRSSLPSNDRFRVPFREGLGSLQDELIADQRSRIDKILTVLLIISIIVSITVLVYVIVTPKQGEKFTEFYILGPGGMAYDYPTDVVAGDTSMVVVGVVNHEYRPVNYTLHLSFDGSVLVHRDLTLDHNQTWEEPVSYVLEYPGVRYRPEFVLNDSLSSPYRDPYLHLSYGDFPTIGEDGLGRNPSWEDPSNYFQKRPVDRQKLEFLLYREGNFTAPYRDLHLWVNVTQSEPLQLFRSSPRSPFHKAGPPRSPPPP